MAASMSPDDFEVGWICALKEELAASWMMFDEVYNNVEGLDKKDANVYKWGKVGSHNVVMTALQADEVGTDTAAKVATNMARTCKQLRFGLMVGVGGGVPTKENDVRLGDIVVSHGVIQHDLGKEMPDGIFKNTGALSRPSNVLLSAVQWMQAQHSNNRALISSSMEDALAKSTENREEYSRPSATYDVLYETECTHAAGDSCERCEEHQEVQRKARSDDNPHIHYGLIASGNRVIRSMRERDRLRQTLHEKFGEGADILCIEMEAAGLMKCLECGCLVIRGISDYCDSKKNDYWKSYASLAAAAYAKTLLALFPRRSDPGLEKTPSQTPSFPPGAPPEGSLESPGILTMDPASLSPNFSFQFSVPDTALREKPERPLASRYGISMIGLQLPLPTTSLMPPPSTNPPSDVFFTIPFFGDSSMEMKSVVEDWITKSGTSSSAKFSSGSILVQGQLVSNNTSSTHLMQPVNVHVTLTIIDSVKRKKLFEQNKEYSKTPFAIICSSLEQGEKDFANHCFAWSEIATSVQEWKPPLIVLGLSSMDKYIRAPGAGDRLVLPQNDCVTVAQELDASMYIEVAKRNQAGRQNLFSMLIGYAAASVINSGSQGS